MWQSKQKPTCKGAEAEARRALRTLPAVPVSGWCWTPSGPTPWPSPRRLQCLPQTSSWVLTEMSKVPSGATRWPWPRGRRNDEVLALPGHDCTPGPACALPSVLLNPPDQSFLVLIAFLRMKKLKPTCGNLLGPQIEQGEASWSEITVNSGLCKISLLRRWMNSENLT